MITYDTRPLTEEERAVVEQIREKNGGPNERVQLTLRVTALWLVGGWLAFFALAWLGGFLYDRHLPALLRCLLLTVVGVKAALFLYDTAKKERRDTEREWERRAAWCEEVISRGQMEVLHVEATGVVAVEGWADEKGKDAYFLDLDDGTALFLSGDYLAEAVEQDRFPCTAFDLLRYPGEAVIRSIECRGEPFADWQRLDGETLEDGYSPADGEVVPVSLPTLAADLERLSNPLPEEE